MLSLKSKDLGTAKILNVLTKAKNVLKPTETTGNHLKPAETS